MSRTQALIVAILAAGLVATAFMLGSWAEKINPEGIMPHPAAADEIAQEAPTPRNAFYFGASMGLLGAGLLYCCIAFGLFIQAKSKGREISQFILWVAGLAALGFALSYLVDDYFY